MTTSPASTTTTAAERSNAPGTTSTMAGRPPLPGPASLPATMRAVVQHRYGGPEVLGLGTVEVPTPAADQVLIEVAAAGIDRGTHHLMTGLPVLVRVAGFGVRRPKQPVPGLDVAGRVIAVGSEVTRFAPGDEVFGIGTGTFAQYALAAESKLTHRPDALSPIDAAAVAVSSGPALQALRDHGRIEAGRRVLILGASGGVGSWAVQLAKVFGAHVTGVAGPAKQDLVRSLGADEVLDYTTTDALDGSARYDLILDIGGLNPVRKLRRALTGSGTLVIVGGEGGGRVTGGIGRQIRAKLLSPFVSQRLTFFMASEHHDNTDTVAQLITEGRVRPHVEQTYPLDQAPSAMENLAAGRIRGKAVITVGATG